MAHKILKAHNLKNCKNNRALNMAALRESLLVSLLQEEALSRSHQASAAEQFARKLLHHSTSGIQCQPLGPPFPSLELHSKLTASIEIQRQKEQQQQEKLLLEYQLLAAAQRRKRLAAAQQTPRCFSLQLQADAACQSNDFLSAASLQKIAGSKRSLVGDLAALQQQHKRMRLQDGAASVQQSKVPAVPCRCRGMPDDHNPKTAFIVIPADAEHGQSLMCSHPICQARGVRFRYCASCKRPVAKRNFSSRHSHHHPARMDSDTKPAVSSDSEEDSVTSSSK